MTPRMPIALALSLVTLASLAGCRSSPDASAEAQAKARATCEKDPEYAAKDSTEAARALDQYCATHPCPGRAKIAALCAYRKKSTPQSSAVFEAVTTIARGETELEQSVCTSVRASGAISPFAQLEVYCSNGKRCMTCGTGR